MAQHLLSVHGVDSDLDPAAGKFGGYSSREEAESALAATGAFNDKLAADGHLSSPAACARRPRRRWSTARV